jgi:hypothetical protein
VSHPLLPLSCAITSSSCECALHAPSRIADHPGMPWMVLCAGIWRTYILPPRQGASSSETNMLRVVGDWNGPSAAFNLFIEYR